jgi:hypothetical protein
VTRLVILFLVASLLGGCSAVRFAYDNADTYLHWRAMSYLDLHAEAVDDLDDRIGRLLAWHRRHSLPQYATLAEDASARVKRGLTRADAAWAYDSVQAQAREGLRAVAEQFAPVLDRLTPEQQLHFEQRIADENRKFARDFLRGSVEERRARRAQRVEERLEDWVGRLSRAQVERIRLFSERAPLADELRDQDRKRIQAEVLAMVRARRAVERLPALAMDWRKGRDPAFSAANEAWRAEIYALFVDLDRTLTPAQRARAVAQFDAYAQDLRLLAARGAP